ncbi:uncharacterized protein N7483_012599 [Penicillium malachiteum]|uniref:uncharacterized protein n=1 Tax=Penicillium malachiteum TaxID=1324776 RepID=UPI002546AC7E|nr:uncharacterized protein N7483_012599 [Penicillium malachiteum]KAJ5715418.1 hypothetical protein N7483_012599 [Penicillium malachiteum]
MTSNSFPYDVPDAWMGRTPHQSDYPVYTHETSPTFPAEDLECPPVSNRDLFTLPMPSETQSMNPAFPVTPGTCPPDFRTSPMGDGAYYDHHSPEYNHPSYHPRDTGYGTITRPQTRPQNPNYSPPYLQRAPPVEPAPPIGDAHRIHRRSSSAVHLPTAAERFLHSGFRCEWKGCRYTGAFGRKFELKRHVETQHIFPNSFECPDPRCRKPYNRKDNLEEHLRRVHLCGI